MKLRSWAGGLTFSACISLTFRFDILCARARQRARERESNATHYREKANVFFSSRSVLFARLADKRPSGSFVTSPEFLGSRDFPRLLTTAMNARVRELCPRNFAPVVLRSALEKYHDSLRFHCCAACPFLYRTMAENRDRYPLRRNSYTNQLHNKLTDSKFRRQRSRRAFNRIFAN